VWTHRVGSWVMALVKISGLANHRVGGRGLVGDGDRLGGITG